MNSDKAREATPEKVDLGSPDRNPLLSNSDIWKDLTHSEEFHNISTLGSTKQVNQPKFLQQLLVLSSREAKPTPQEDLFPAKKASGLRNRRGVQDDFNINNPKGNGQFRRIMLSDTQDSQVNNTLQPSETATNLLSEPKATLRSPARIAERHSVMAALRQNTIKFGDDTSEQSPTTEKDKRNLEFQLATQKLRKKSFYGQIVDGGWKEITNALMSKMRVRSIFHQILKKDITLSNVECELVGDKAYIWDTSSLSKGNNGHRALKKKPRLKALMEKHAIVRSDIKTEFVKRLLNEINQKKKTKWTLVMETMMKCKHQAIQLGQRIKQVGVNFLRPWQANSKKRLIWDICSALFTLYEVVSIPFFIGFDFTQTREMMAFELAKDIFFFCEIMLNFHTGYISDGVCITNRKKIAIHYLRTWLPIDIIANMPYVEFITLRYEGFSGLLVDSSEGSLKVARVFKLLRILKWVKIRRIIAKVQHHSQSEVVNSLISLLKLLLYVIFLAHWIACLWHYVGLMDADSDSSWLLTFRFYEESRFYRYMVCLYWAITTMLTVGYGDITPVNSIERAVNIVSMMVGCGMFAYIMNSIGILLQNINQEVSKKRQKYFLVTRYMKRKNVPKDMQDKVQHYLDYLFDSKSEIISEEEGALNLLSDTLQEELRKEINGKVLRENTLFQMIFGNKFLSILSKNLEEKIFSPDEIIFDETDTEFTMYFISAGTVQIYFSNCKKDLKCLEKDVHFGEIAFFSDKPRTAAAKSITFSSIFLLKKAKFLALLENHGPEKETYHLIKDKINLYEDYEILKFVCFACGNKGHSAKQCPNIHYSLSPEEVIHIYLKKHEKFCEKFRRNPRREKTSSLGKLKRIQLRASQFALDNVTLIKSLRHSLTTSARSLVLKQKQNYHLDRDSIENKLKNIKFNRMATVAPVDIEMSPVVTGNPSPPKLRFPSPQRSTIHEVDEETDLLKEISIEDDIDNEFEEQARRSMYRRDSKKKKTGLFTGGFDAVRNYPLYFPHNNVTKIIESIEQQKAKKLKLKEIKLQVEDVKLEVEKLQEMSRRNSMSLSSPYLGPTPKKKRNSFFPHREW